MTDKAAAFWLRVSTPDQLVENQTPALEHLAESRGLTVVLRYEKDGRLGVFHFGAVAVAACRLNARHKWSRA